MFSTRAKTYPVGTMANLKRKPASQQLDLIREVNPKEAFRDIRNYLAGQFIGSTRDSALLDEVMKCLFYKLYVELGHAKPIGNDESVIDRAKHARSVFSTVRKDFHDIYSSETEILLSPEAISYILDTCSFSLIDSRSDPVGDAFEVFVGGEARGSVGQFFTPRSVTDLLTELVDPKPEETVIDPACGAGGFLASVARHHLAGGLSKTDLGHVVASNLYGIDKDEYLVNLARLHVSLLTGGEPRIICADSIALRNDSGSVQSSLPTDGLDVVLTNPPFGAKIISALPQVLRSFQLARKWRLDASTDKWEPTNEIRTQVPPQVLFVERCLSILKDGGRFGMVLPESLISNKTHRFVVQYLMDRAHVTAVIGMPDALFKTSGKGGTHTKTCLVVAQKDERRLRGETFVFMAEAKWCGHDSRAKRIPHNDLPVIAENIHAYRKTGHLSASTLGFIIKESEIKENVLCPHYYDPKIEEDLEKLADTHHLWRFGDLVDEGTLSIATGDELGKLAYGTGEIPFVRTSDMSNWEIKTDAKHGVEREIYNRLKKKQDVQPYDLLMVRDGTYLIGTCAIVSPAEKEILYQSHIYKIRVNKNSKGLNAFNLLAVLTCPVVQRQIRAKQFTQDIIDSLGSRILELVLPISKDAHKREQIDELVKSAIEQRALARESAQKARELAGAPTGMQFSLRNGTPH
jgi:type I restriction enzyme M protein